MAPTALRLLQDEEQHCSLPLAPLTRWPDAARKADGHDEIRSDEQLLLPVRQTVSRGGVKPALQGPFQRFSYPQLRPPPSTVRDELVHLFGFSDATGRNDAGSLYDDEYHQIARQLPAFSFAASASASFTNRSRSPSPQREHLLRQVPHAFSSELSGPQPAALNQLGQQTSGNTRIPSDSALLAMRSASPMSAASTGPQGESITEKTALELPEATSRESEQQLCRHESAEPEHHGSAFLAEHWLQDTRDMAISSAFHATPRRSTHTKLYPNLSDTVNS